METYGWISILPPLIAITLAIKTRQVFISLAAGIWMGWIVLTGWRPFAGLGATLESFVNVFQEPGNTRVIIFSALVGSLIALTQRSGGVEGFVNFLLKRKWIESRRSAQLLAWFLGVIIFIESSIKILIVGTTCRPLFDRLKISREKLAYIADATSAATCMLIPLNAWGAFTIGLLTSQNVENPTSVLISSIPFNFYAIITVVMVFVLVYKNFDFGPMKQAEKRVQNGQLLREGAQPLMDEDIVEMEPIQDAKHLGRNMLIPVIVMSAFMPIALIITGDGNLTQGSGSTAVFWSVMLAIFVAAVMYRFQKIMSVKELMDVILKGAGGMISLAILMMLAFSLGDTCKQLGTGRYVANLTSQFLHVGLVPVLVFAISGFVAFSTGTSFGTFALMIPLAVPFVDTLGVNLPLVVSAVLGGGVFGDHCSPISDTTLVSSMATASDHIDHVRTQMPYALTAAGFAALVYLAAGFLT
ncbi:MAG TPA: Na+/H+ antiporter NhaC family protein [bacterium]|nr:Na+/H+ antiporter NhaC family protein [bacterium]